MERLIYLQQFVDLEVDARLFEMDSSYASEVVKRRVQQPNELGCVEHTLQRREPYAKVNLRQKDFGNQYLHHIALIAADRKNELKAVVATNKSLSQNDHNRLQVSHLCHNSYCVNHNHLVVEAAKDNLARNSCKGSHNIQFFIAGDEYIWNGCPHRKSPLHKHCILPFRTVEMNPGYNCI
uniref:Putative homing endonuclease n=1 Tax=uncultured Rhizophydiales TaxID=687209 RepID=A0A4V1GQI5_9FUNG|nr:putative homing endonuclease [uncultured Rhizophydiales]